MIKCFFICYEKEDTGKEGRGGIQEDRQMNGNTVSRQTEQKRVERGEWRGATVSVREYRYS